MFVEFCVRNPGSPPPIASARASVLLPVGGTLGAVAQERGKFASPNSCHIFRLAAEKYDASGGRLVSYFSARS